MECQTREVWQPGGSREGNISMSTSGRRLLSQAESAEYLGVSTRTIRSYIAHGTLKANRIRGSRLIRINRSDLESLVQPIPTLRCDEP